MNLPQASAWGAPRYGATPAASYLVTSPMSEYQSPSNQCDQSYYEEAKLHSAGTGKRRMNSVAILLSFLVPWLLFSITFAVLTFGIHYYHASWAYACVACGFLVVMAAGINVRGDPQNKMEEQALYVPTWCLFYFITVSIAWLLAVVAGLANFHYNAEPYYDVTSLHHYTDIDPASTSGQELMDAGLIMFTNKTHLDIGLSTGLFNRDVYCVAPITAGPDRPMYYDFWAVGKNCCSGGTGNFRCGDYRNPHARAGLRLMNDDEHAFYTLAVQQAQAAFNISSYHPLFLYWMQDPTAEISMYHSDALQYFVFGVLAFFCFQLALVFVAALAFSKLNSPQCQLY